MGVAIGIRIATPHAPPALSETALQEMRSRIASLRASEGKVVERWRDIARDSPEPIRAEAEAIAAGEEPVVAAAFDIAPVEVTERTAEPPACDPCLPEEFRVAGIFEAFAGGQSALVASLTHAHGPDVIWRSKLQGRLTYKPPPLPPVETRWLAGGYVALDEGGEKAYGGLVARTWRHVAVFGGVDDSPRVLAGVAVRW